jgi:hypothetical protein
MSTGAIVAIVIGALILIALAVMLARRGRERRLESMREEAQEHRSQARMRARTAEREQADADEAAARAKKARAIAEEQAAQARRAEAEAEAKSEHAQHERGHAEELHGRATELDPDEGRDDSESNGRRRLFGRGRDENQVDQVDEREQTTDETQQVPARGRQDSTH